MGRREQTLAIEWIPLEEGEEGGRKGKGAARLSRTAEVKVWV
jgi:hypothetical protein